MEEMNYKKIGERLHKLREFMGLTQEQVASILNIGRDAVLRIEKGIRKIDIQELIKFSKLYSVSVDEIINVKPINQGLETSFARSFDGLSDKDKKEILDLIAFKNEIKSKRD